MRLLDYCAARATCTTRQVEAVDNKDGTVNLKVTTRDFWTLKPGFTVSRAGGENKIGVDLEELNLLGNGQSIRFGRDENVDRTSEAFEFRDPHIGSTRMDGRLEISDNSDGDLTSASLIRPFFALDYSLVNGCFWLR